MSDIAENIRGQNSIDLLFFVIIFCTWPCVVAIQMVSLSPIFPVTKAKRETQLQELWFYINPNNFSQAKRKSYLTDAEGKLLQ